MARSKKVKCESKETKEVKDKPIETSSGIVIPKNEFDVTNTILWKKVVGDIINHFSYVDENGIPVFKTLLLYSRNYSSGFTYGFAMQLKSKFSEQGYFFDWGNTEDGGIVIGIGIEPIYIP